jgi:hypothetical protein
MLFLWLVNFPFHFGIFVFLYINPRKKIEEMMTANYSNCLDSPGTPSLFSFFPTPPPLTLASFHAVLNWVDSRAYLSLPRVCSPFRATGDNNDETHKVCAPIVERDHFERSVCYFCERPLFVLVLFLFSSHLI